MDPHHPGVVRAHTEVQRRSRQMTRLSQQLGGEGHPLVQLVMWCLHNDPGQRPPARQVLQRLERMRARMEDPYERMTRLELIEALRRREGLQAHVAQLESEVRVKEQEIQELRAEQSRSTAGATTLTETSHQPQVFHWRQGTDLPFKTISICAVALNGKIYVGGGQADTCENDCVVLVYTPGSDDSWSRLPRLPMTWFTLAIVNQQLLLVGTVHHGDPTQTTVQVWDGMLCEWTAPYQNMTTAAHSATAIGYQQYLIVAGGHSHSGVTLSTVQILNTSTNRWSTTSPLPVGCFSLSAAVVGDTLYLVGGRTATSHNKQMFSTSLPALLAQTTTVSPTPSVTWEATDVELALSTAVAIQSSLLVVGGRVPRGSRSSAIHLYATLTRQWSKIGDMPAAVSACSCVVLSSRELVVLGGWGDGGCSTQVHFATVN